MSIEVAAAGAQTTPQVLTLNSYGVGNKYAFNDRKWYCSNAGVE
jgi:hypothetical protein